MKKQKSNVVRRKIPVLTIIGMVFIIIFGFMLICNLVIIIKSAIRPDEPPAIFGVMPMVVKSGSMSGEAKDHIEVDDLIIVRSVDSEELDVGDIIAYMDGKVITTHRIVSIEEDGGERRFVTKGDANNVNDDPITADKIIGIYRFRIPKLGKVIVFLQSPLGLIWGIGLPIIIYINLRFIFRKKRGGGKGEPVKSEKDEPVKSEKDEPTKGELNKRPAKGERKKRPAKDKA